MDEANCFGFRRKDGKTVDHGVLYSNCCIKDAYKMHKYLDDAVCRTVLSNHQRKKYLTSGSFWYSTQSNLTVQAGDDSASKQSDV